MVINLSSFSTSFNLMEEKIMTMNLNNNVKEKEKTSIYDVKELAEEGYLDDTTGAYVPYPNKDNPEFYLKISRTEGKKSEIVYAWGKYSEKSFNIITMYKSPKLISEDNDKLVDSLLKAAKNAGIDIDEEEFEEFVNTFLTNIRQFNGLDVLKESNFKFPEPEEKDETIDEEEEVSFGFDSYPELIQKEALNIVNDGSLYDKYVDSISITHAGNETTKEQLALISVSLFIGEPTHTELDANTGQGKTDVTTETVKNIPDCYVHHLSTVSPKNIYYDRDSYGAYNIVIFDDVVLTDETIGLLKVLSDNNKPVKELKTVIDKKAVNFTLPGKFLVIITYAKDNPDEELLNRLYKLNMNVDEDSKSKIKNKIKINTIVNAEDNEIISKSRLIIQAAIQYLIEQDFEIFNPFAVLFDPTSLENRNIKHFIAMVKSRSFFHTINLKKINFAGKTIYIGPYEDFKHVAEIWSKEADTQKYKLNDKEKLILDILTEKTRDEAINYVEDKLNEYKNSTPTKQAKILDSLDTRKTISKRIGVNETTVRNYLDRSQGTAKSLVDAGLVNRVRFNSDNNNSPWVYYKVKKEENQDEKTLWHNWQIEDAKHFDTFEDKIRILLSLFYLANIALNERGYIFLKNYCEDETNTIDLNDYNSYYDFINNAIMNFDFNIYAIKLDNAKLADLKYMTDLFSFPQDTVEKNNQDKNSASFAKQSKIDDNASITNTTSNSYGKFHLPSVAKQQDTISKDNPDSNSSKLDSKTNNNDFEILDYDKDFEERMKAQEEMENSHTLLETYTLDFTVEDCQVRICDCLSKKKLGSRQLMDKVLPSENGRKIGIGLFKKALRKLESANIISKDKEDYYCLNDSSNEMEKSAILMRNLTSQKCQLRVCGLLAKQDMAKDVILKKLKKSIDIDDGELSLMLDNSLESLEGKGAIESKEMDNIKHYHLMSDFKEQLN